MHSSSPAPAGYPADGVIAVQVFIESGEAVGIPSVPGEDAKTQLGCGFYGEEAFITTLSMMVEDNCVLTVESATNTQRKEGLKAVSECYCLELGIKDVFEVFGGNRDVLRLLAKKLKLKADVEALGAPESPGVALAAPPSPLTRSHQAESDTTNGGETQKGSKRSNSRGVNCVVKMCIPPQRWAQCVRRMKHVTFAPGESIVMAGQLGTSMYFVDAGRCRYIGEDRTVLELNDGEFFGELAFVTTLRIMSQSEGNITIDEARTARRKGSVLAVTTCSCLELSVKDVFEAFDSNRTLLKSALMFMDVSPQLQDRVCRQNSAGVASGDGSGGRGGGGGSGSSGLRLCRSTSNLMDELEALDEETAAATSEAFDDEVCMRQTPSGTPARVCRHWARRTGM